MLKRLALVAAFLMLPVLLFAGTGKIKGKVTDRDSKEPLIGASVQIVGTTQGAVTDLEGNYVILNVQTGPAVLKSSYVGYQAITLSNVLVNSDLTTEANFNLPAEGVQVPTVIIVAQRPLVNKSATNAVRISTSEDIAAIPTRGVNNVLALQPGVVLQDNTVYIRGGRADEVGYYLEGVPITNRMAGGRAVTLVQDALEEIQVQAGGYNAEFGQANAGIIQTQLKSGTSQVKASAEYITDNLGFRSSKNAYNGQKTLGAYQYGYTEFVGTVSGPIGSDKFKFFGLFDYNFQRDANPQPYPGVNLGWVKDPLLNDSVNMSYPAGPVYGNSLNQFTYTGTITADFNPIKVRVGGTYTLNTTYNAFSAARNAGNLANILNTSRIEQVDARNGTLNLKLTHLLNPTTYYDVTFGYFQQSSATFDPALGDDFMHYGDSVANAKAGYVWVRNPGDRTGQYTRPNRLTLYDLSFNAPGDVVADYIKFKRENISIAGALSSQYNAENAIKIGGEYQRYSMRNYSMGNETAFSLAELIASNDKLPVGDPSKVSTEELLLNRGINNFGYDIFGNEADPGGMNNAKHPVFGALYFQDKIEYQDLIINFGLRYDYINSDSKTFKYPTIPDSSIDKNTLKINENYMLSVPSFSGVAPRLGFSFPVSDRTVFHAQYGKFVQQSRLRDIYQGIYATGYNIRGGFFINAPVGFDIRPERTTQYEIGFTQQLGEFASFDVTGYYKDTQDQIVYDQIVTDKKVSKFGDYAILRNGDFATTKGLEFTLNLRRTKRLQMNASVSFNDAQGTGSNPNSNRGIVGAPIDGSTIYRPAYVSPLDFNNAIRGNVNLDYHFGRNDGPSWLEQAGLSALLKFNSGHPYTRGVGGADLEGDARDRQPVEPLNTSSTPWTFQIDLRIDKTFNITDKVGANIYLQVFNLLDARNIENVFLRTGSTTDDGYLSDPALGGKLVQTYGQQYADLYRAVNLDYYEQYQNAPGLLTAPNFYGPPRQMRLGVRLEY